MLRRYFLIGWIVLSLFASGCSIEVNQAPVTASPAPGTPNGKETLPPNATQIPVTWGNLNLTGKLVYVAANSSTALLSILSLDLKTGALVPVFQAPHGSWTDAAAVAPDHKTLVTAYAPPMNVIYGGQQSLYTMPLDSSRLPEILVIPPTDQDQYFQPTWSPDGKYLYFVHINTQSTESYEIMRMAYPNGSPEKIAKGAYWPRLSDDGTRILYVALAPQSGANTLFSADADGMNAQQVQISGLPVPSVIDAPMFSSDNKTIYFSSPIGLKSSAPNWIDRLLGVQIAHADGSLPSEWWSVPASGGTAKQLTHIEALALYGVFSPDKQHIGSYSSNGIFVMKPDGSDVTMIVSDVGGIAATVNWIP